MVEGQCWQARRGAAIDASRTPAQRPEPLLRETPLGYTKWSQSGGGALMGMG